MDPFSAINQQLFHHEMDIKHVQDIQAMHSERILKLERKQADDAALKSVWTSPFPSVLTGTPNQGPHFSLHICNLFNHIQDLYTPRQPMCLTTSTTSTASHSSAAFTSTRSLSAAALPAPTASVSPMTSVLSKAQAGPPDMCHGPPMTFLLAPTAHLDVVIPWSGL